MSSAVRKKESMSSEPQEGMSGPAVAMWGNGLLSRVKCSTAVMHDHTYHHQISCPRGEADTTATTVSYCEDRDWNIRDEQLASETSRNSFCSRSYDYAMTVSRKRHCYLCCSPFLLILKPFWYISAYLCGMCMHTLSDIPKQPHHRLKEIGFP